MSQRKPFGRTPRKMAKSWRVAAPIPTRSGAYAEIVAYVEAVISDRTEVHSDTSARRLARGITYSVLARLGYTSRQRLGIDPLSDEATPRLRPRRRWRERYRRHGYGSDA